MKLIKSSWTLNNIISKKITNIQGSNFLKKNFIYITQMSWFDIDLFGSRRIKSRCKVTTISTAEIESDLK